MTSVCVVGGGAIGLATAWEAARRGVSTALVDPDPARGASRVAAGMLAPVTEVHYGETDLLELNLAAASAWPQFAHGLAEASGSDPGYEQCGTVAVARDTDDLAAIERLFAYQRDLGLSVTRLRSKECRELEPALAPTTRGGVLVEGDHQVDNRKLVGALLAACQRSGVEQVADHAVSVAAGEVRTASAGAIEADWIVVATGAWTSQLDGLPDHVRRFVRPVKGQIVRLSGKPVITRVLRGEDAYLVPRSSGEIVVGATVEERGFDTSVTAGAVHDLLRAAFELVPDLRELAVVETGAGLRPGSRDNAPLIGVVAPGIAIATGHYRNGILLAPVTARAVIDLVLGETPSFDVAAFAPARAEEAVA